MKNFIVTIKNGKTLLVSKSSPFKVSNEVKASGKQPTMVLEV